MKTIYKTTLKNGLKLVYLHSPTAKTAMVKLTGRAGSIFEKDRLGLAHFLEHTLFQGSKKYSSAEKLADLVKFYGGRLGGGTSYLTVGFYVEVLKENYEHGFEFLSELLLNPLFEEEQMEREKKVVMREINRKFTDPEKYLTHLATTKLYRGTRVEIPSIGTVEQIENISMKEVNNFYNKYYTSGNFVLSVWGDLDKRSLTKACNKYFAGFKPGKLMPFPKVTNDKAFEVTVEKKSDLKITYLDIAFPAFDFRDNRVYSASFLRNIFGKGVFSRLGKRIRLEQGLSYSVQASNNSWESSGIFHLKTSVKSENLKEVMEIIKEEIVKITTELLADEEFERLKNNSKFNFVKFSESTNSYLDFYTDIEIYQRSAKDIESYLNKIEDRTKEDVLAVAKEILTKDPKITILTPDDINPGTVKEYWLGK